MRPRICFLAFIQHNNVLSNLRAEGEMSSENENELIPHRPYFWAMRLGCSHLLEWAGKLEESDSQPDPGTSRAPELDAWLDLDK